MKARAYVRPQGKFRFFSQYMAYQYAYENIQRKYLPMVRAAAEGKLAL